MTDLVRLKKNEERRLRAGHLWIYSNEIDTKISPLKSFKAGQIVRIEAADKTFLGIGYINPHSLISVRLMTRQNNETLDVNFFKNRITAAYNLRHQLYEKPFYRLVFGDSDQLPGLIIDRFGNHLVAQLNTAGMENLLEPLTAALLAIFPETESILLRNDSSARSQEGLEQYIKTGFGNPPPEVLLEENNAKFYAPIWDGQKTGWFYDHRLNRSRLKTYVKQKKVLDVFSYLGGWGIQAAVAGASAVTCIDASATAVDFIQKNAELNQISEKVDVICDDAFDALKKLAQENKKFDVVILDPPAFAKKQKDLKEGLLGYQRINELALKLLTTDGILITCSCSMHVSEEEFLQALRRASLKTNVPMQIIERGHQAPDHPVHFAIPETDYLKMIIARKMTLNK